jgi:hypothetical protein
MERGTRFRSHTLRQLDDMRYITCSTELADTSLSSTGEAGDAAGAGGAALSAVAAAGDKDGFDFAASGFFEDDADTASDGAGKFFSSTTSALVSAGVLSTLKFWLGAAASCCCCCSCCCSCFAVSASRRSILSPFNCVSISLLFGSRESASSASATASTSCPMPCARRENSGGCNAARGLPCTPSRDG